MKAFSLVEQTRKSSVLLLLPVQPASLRPFSSTPAISETPPFLPVGDPLEIEESASEFIGDRESESLQKEAKGRNRVPGGTSSSPAHYFRSRGLTACFWPSSPAVNSPALLLVFSRAHWSSSTMGSPSPSSCFVCTAVAQSALKLDGQIARQKELVKRADKDLKSAWQDHKEVGKELEDAKKCISDFEQVFARKDDELKTTGEELARSKEELKLNREELKKKDQTYALTIEELKDARAGFEVRELVSAYKARH